VHVDIEQIGQSIFKWMPFSMGLVTFGSEPARVPEDFIHALRARLEEINREGPQDLQTFSKGERVAIRSGPFEGYTALFDAHIPGGERAKVLIEFLSGQYVRLDVHSINIEARRT
jgi:transcriptional antiterminator RfaH